MSDEIMSCSYVFILWLDTERRKKLTQLARFHDLLSAAYLRRLIDEDWERRRPLVEYMEAEK